jgi:predicted  nucleic acid-binding Zn-ribbon protein
MTKNQGGLSLEQFNKLATKDDLNAIKKDLKNFITKEDAKKFATKDDLKKFTTKDVVKRLEEKSDKMLISVLSTKDDLSVLSGKFDKLEENVGKILTTVDGIAKDFKRVGEEFVANKGAHNRMQKEINETRTKVGLKISSVV